MELFDYYVVLPCKIGDIFYDIKGKQFKCIGFHCYEQSSKIPERTEPWTVMLNGSNSGFPLHVGFSKFPKSYFPSMDEARDAARKMEEEKERQMTLAC